MSTAKVTGFAKVLVAPTFRVGKTYAIQSSGLGSLEPNTLVMGWPSKWREEGHENSAEVSLCCVSQNLWWSHHFCFNKSEVGLHSLGCTLISCLI